MSNPGLAIFGAAPVFEHVVPVGQLYFPEWSRYVDAMRGIFERKYYTNQGPLVQQLEQQLQERLGVRHAICVTNATIGLIMAAEALQLSGRVVTPAYSFVATSQALTWAGLTPKFCDVDIQTHQADATKILPLLEDNSVSAILAVNLWGDVCDHRALQTVADKRGIPLFYDSAHAFGCAVAGVPVGNFGALEVFSFHATKVLSAAEGGCVCTNDDELAARLRNIRSSYGAGCPVAVARTANGRMSEAQAAMALLSLEDFPQIMSRNEALYAGYRRLLNKVPGLRLLEPEAVSKTNYQYVVLQVDAQEFGLTRDELQAVLHAENVLARRYFYPGIHRCQPYDVLCTDAIDRLPVTDQLCASVLQLPIGQLVSEVDVQRIAEVILIASQHAERVRAVLSATV